jgi:hypothetical protein
MNIIWTKHAEERQKEWEKKMGTTRSEVEDLLRNPEQVAPGDMDAFVAQTKVVKDCYVFHLKILERVGKY